jgi:hypothetical protein
MPHLEHAIRSRRFIFTLLAVGLAGAWSLADAAPPRPAAPRTPVAPPPPRSALLTVEAWQKAPAQPLRPGEIDDLVAHELQAAKVQPAPVTTDEQFVRRVTLDLTGELPLPADVTEFVADPRPDKRARLIDKLLDSDEYARHWARYWRAVIAAKVTDLRGLLLARGFEDWMFEQFKANKGWDQIARDMITAGGEYRFDEPAKNGALFFLASHNGADAANERAAETSRVFLGIQIQCAQCHDHPFDQWKRVQFHELAGYFARMLERPIRDGMRLAGFEVISLPRGEHQMPSKEDPKKGLITPPRFLNGKSPGTDLSDAERRRALADEVVSPNNYWFAGAYVNRVWGELMGQSFYEPVDDMGPQKEVVFPSVLTRLTGAFRGTRFDVKALFRAALNSQTYQRQIRLGESADAHLHFAAAYPTRLRPDALWQSLVSVLGSLGGPRGPDAVRPGMGPFRGPQGFEGLFKAEFEFDPSLKPDEVEGSIPQALLLMNSPVIHQRIQARGTNLLARILKAYPHDDDALRMVYLRTLARKPTDRELHKCRTYIDKTGNRAEAFEDILWALLNSTEFQTKR